MSNTIFGYGSLILPTSLIHRFERFESDIDNVYSRENYYIRSDVKKAWEEKYSHRIEYIPIKLFGFKRYYSLNSIRGGAMLEIFQTNNKNDWINGVLIKGLKDEELNQIHNTEVKYEYTLFDKSQFNYYKNNDYNIKEVGFYKPNKNLSDIQPDRPKNETYHQRIQKGIQMLDEDIAPRFAKDYNKSTYEAVDNTFERLSNNI